VPKDALLSAVDLMVSVQHQNVVLFVGFCMEPPCLATECCEQGSMQDVLRVASSRAASPVAPLTWRRLLLMVADAASGMQHLHSLNIIHRDLRSSNLLVATDWSVKVADYYTYTLINQVAKQGGGTLQSTRQEWRAPEVMEGRPYAPASDVYSFGVVLWEVLTWKEPWSNVNPWAVRHHILV